MNKKETVVYIDGIGLGTALAMILSWETNHSILWATLHGILSWFYVLYWAIIH